MDITPFWFNLNGIQSILVTSVNGPLIGLVDRLQYGNQNRREAPRAATRSILAKATKRKHVEEWQNSSVQLSRERRADLLEMEDEVSIMRSLPSQHSFPIRWVSCSLRLDEICHEQTLSVAFFSSIRNALPKFQTSKAPLTGIERSHHLGT